MNKNFIWGAKLRRIFYKYKNQIRNGRRPSKSTNLDLFAADLNPQLLNIIPKYYY